ncbi:MAG: hypothetical protein HY291_11680 [Planctomycetes bacterium]|nr:hypothetical protein [Planctomycetota bacterium]
MAKSGIAAVVLCVCLCGLAARGVDVNHVAKALPEFKLKDPAGAEHAQGEVQERGALVIVTIPNVKHSVPQDQWARWVTKKGWKKDGPRLVFIEDLSQIESAKVKETALAKLKDRFEPGKNPLLLLDPAGEVRKAFGVNVDETVVVLVNKKGAVVKSWEGEPSIEAAKEIVEAVDKLGN